MADLAQATFNSLVHAIGSAPAKEIRDLLNIIDVLSGVEVGYIDGVVAGTAQASKAVVLDGSGNIAWVDGGTIDVGTTTGLKIGTAAAQKLGFWNATPVVQPSGATQAAPSAYATGAFGLNSNANMQALYDLVVAMRTALVDAGIIKGSA